MVHSNAESSQTDLIHLAVEAKAHKWRGGGDDERYGRSGAPGEKMTEVEGKRGPCCRRWKLVGRWKCKRFSAAGSCSRCDSGSTHMPDTPLAVIQVSVTMGRPAPRVPLPQFDSHWHVTSLIFYFLYPFFPSVFLSFILFAPRGGGQSPRQLLSPAALTDVTTFHTLLRLLFLLLILLHRLGPLPSLLLCFFLLP